MSGRQRGGAKGGAPTVKKAAHEADFRVDIRNRRRYRQRSDEFGSALSDGGPAGTDVAFDEEEIVIVEQ